MIVLIFAILLFIFGCYQGYKVLWPQDKPFRYEPPTYTEYEKQIIDKWNRIDEQERRRKERMKGSRATEILKFEFLRQHGIISQEDFERAKNDLI